MKTIYSLLFVIFFSLDAFAQVDVTASSGTLNASYTTLKAAFDQMNLGTHTGTITIGISANTTETASAILNASGSGAASYSTITISPAGGAARTISGTIAGPLIDLNGADNVTIDGLNTGGNSLIISNSSTSTGASTIRFIADAGSNVINRCSIRGSGGAGGASGLGVIYFATGTTSGNDNNTISNNSIGPVGTNLPINGIYSIGTSAVADNSGINILNNTIFDYFNATAVSNGINVSSFNSAWTISGNSFYQTASRTYTTANTHSVINVASGNGYTITNNFIGGSSASALGTPYVMAGTVATRFIGINIAVGTTTVTNIQGNTIANITLNTSSGNDLLNGIFCAINITAGNVNVGTTTSNTIGATTGIDNIKATSTTTGALVVGIHSSSLGTIVIQNNTMGSLTCSGVTAAIAGSVTGINVSGVAASMTISGNTIGNTTIDNIVGGTTGLTTGASLVSGINLPGTPAGTVTIAGNTIRNLSSYGTGSGFVRGIWTASSVSSSTVFSITGNTISVLTTNATLTGVVNGQAALVGINSAAGTNNIISQNTIHTFSNTNTTTTGNYAAGITTANATSTTITKNRIYNIANAGTSTTTATPSVVAGIIIRSGTTEVTISNNMISLGNGQTTNTSFLGIQCNNGVTPDPLSKIYYNSIHIEGTVLSGNQPSFGIARTDFSTTARTAPVNIKNNLINNTRSGGGGNHYAIGNNYGALAASSTGWGANASNYNLLNSNAATIGYWVGARTFTSWKNSSASDSNSLSAKPVSFTNITTANLHLNFGITPTSIESAGTPIIGITNDYDNDTRPGPAGSVNGGTYAPDLGADEFDGVYFDIIPPVITYTPLGFTCDTGSRTLVATITDFLGIPVSATGLPRLYWKINAGPYTAVTGTSLGADQYQFVFGGGVTAGNVVSYYVAAQDNFSTPNVSIIPSAGAASITANPPAAATPPSSPSTYNVYAVLPAGTYTVGPGGNYTSLSAAINAYNTSCLAGPIVFELLNGTHYLASGWTINKHPYANAVNTLTIRPAAGASPYIGGNTYVSLRILGNYVTIDGSNNGSQSRDLTIGNNSTVTPIAILIGSTGNSPINNVTIKNCNITTSALTNPAVVISDGATYGDSGYFNNINFTNNKVYYANIGLYASAVTAVGNGNGFNITNNTMNVSSFDALRTGGVYLQGIDGATISGNGFGNYETSVLGSDFGVSLFNCSNTSILNNTITNLGSTNTGDAAPTGILVDANMPASGITINGNTISGLSSSGGSGGISTTGITIANAVSGVSITQNKISQITNSKNPGWGSHGILLNTTSLLANITVANNFISNVASYGYPSATVDDNGYGISVNAGAGYSIYHNTVNLVVNQTLATGFSAAFFVSAGVTTPGAINARNNIFCNRQTAGSTERYAVYCVAPASVFAAMDYNDYFSTGANLAFLGSNLANLAALQTGFGGNANSKNILPVFISNTDLYLYTNVNNTLDNIGGPIAAVPVDIDSSIRSITTPDVGASEFAFLGYCANVNVSYVSNISGATYQWQVDNGSGYINVTNGGVYGGATTNTLTLISPPTSYARNKYRCLVDGINLSTVNVYKVGDNWTGASSTDWTDTGNWSCGTIPDQYTDVQINPGAPNNPVVNISITIRSLLLKKGANIIVGPGAVINLVGN